MISRSEASTKAWETMKSKEAEMSDDEMAELKEKRCRASRKAWSRRKWNKLMTVRSRIKKRNANGETDI